MSTGRPIDLLFYVLSLFARYGVYLLIPSLVVKPLVTVWLLYPYRLRKGRLWATIVLMQIALLPVSFIIMRSMSLALLSFPGIVVLYGYLLSFQSIIFGVAEAAILFSIFKGGFLRKPDSSHVSFKYTLLVVVLGELSGEFFKKLIFLSFDLNAMLYALGLILLALVLYFSKKYVVLHDTYRKALTVLVVLIAILGMAKHMLPGSAMRGLGDRMNVVQEGKYDCDISDEEAIKISKSFLHIFDIEYNTAPTIDVSSLSNVDYPVIRELKTVRYEYPDRRMKGRFYIDCQSKEVEQFENFESRKHEEIGASLIDYRNAIEMMAGRIHIPDDVIFNKMEYDSRDDLWNGIYIRELGGYKYEWDRVIVGVSASGEPAYYKKVYKGTPCQVKVSIQREEALKVAREQAQNFLPLAQRYKMDELYKLSRAELLIVEPKRPHYLSVGEIDSLPNEKIESRLAWIITFSFTGGLQTPLDGRLFEELSEQERAEYERTLGQRHMLEHKLRVPGHIEIRIDAENGDILSTK